MMRRAFLLPSASACSSSSVLPSPSRHILPRLQMTAFSTITRLEGEEVPATSPSALSQAPDHAADAGTATVEPESSTQPGWRLRPEDIVAHLDNYIVSQRDAKKATAIAMRMRWRRNQLPDEIRAEVTPSNILMKGPTGTGKTEIARRLSTLAEAPFIKVEATRYTEVGFVGANTSDMIKGLMDNAVRLEREVARKQVAAEARAKAEMKVLDLLKLGNTKNTTAQQQEALRSRLRNGDFDHHTVRVAPRETRPSSLPSSTHPLSDLLEGLDLGNINMGSGGFIAIERGPSGPGGRGGGRGGYRGGGGERQVVPVKKALERYVEEFEEALTNEEDVLVRAKHKAENYGIVFIDEIDKLCGSSSADAASTTTTGGGNSSNKGEGVQRELLTLVEGCSVPTRYGTVRTDFMLFIASGAFHHKSPSDLLPELQGRFPVRVALQPLNKADLVQILGAKKFNILEQTKQLLATEGVELEFTTCGIEAMAGFAQLINRSQQDIGARRLNTVMHRVLEELSYMAPRRRGEKVVVDEAFVDGRLKEFDLTKGDNLSRYIL